MLYPGSGRVGRQQGYDLLCVWESMRTVLLGSVGVLKKKKTEEEKKKRKKKKIHFRSVPSDYTKYDRLLWETTESAVIIISLSELGRKKTFS